ncbi:MAG: hypothetical protein QOH62_1194, partial [Solirubrobacteraceae bacterium]|nr:hypothetical protein [Solirubrobacteraceae bacterium]
MSIVGRHPRHAVLAALVAGMLAAGHGPVLAAVVLAGVAAAVRGAARRPA